MRNREKLHGIIQTMAGDRIADAPPISNEVWRERLSQLEEDDSLDAGTKAKLEAAEAEGVDPISLEEVRRRYSLLPALFSSSLRHCAIFTDWFRRWALCFAGREFPARARPSCPHGWPPSLHFDNSCSFFCVNARTCFAASLNCFSSSSP